MKRIHIVGRKNHGKTTLMVDLLRELTRRGLRVGSIKHSSHSHELDTPGKDSFHHHQAGAEPTAVVTPDRVGLYLSRDTHGDFYEQLAPMYANCDLVLVEGHIDGLGPKIEVWRQSLGGSCLAAEHPSIVAVVTDDLPSVPIPTWPRSDIACVADRILELSS
jgi:molybdopterin-guanine dinucleotide biosynthesis adapter protein